MLSILFANIKGIAYGGIVLDFCSIFLFIIFYLIPINNLKSSTFCKLIYHITKYTQGIYSLHLILQRALNSILISIKNGTSFGCVIIYILSYFISFIGEKLSRKTKLIYLFI